MNLKTKKMLLDSGGSCHSEDDIKIAYEYLKKYKKMNRKYSKDDLVKFKDMTIKYPHLNNEALLKLYDKKYPYNHPKNKLLKLRKLNNVIL